MHVSPQEALAFMYGDYEYTETRRVGYGDGATFLPVCPHCCRYVKADDHIRVNGLDEWIKEPNATCSKCGRVTMPFEGWM